VQREHQNLLQDGTGDEPADVLFGSLYHGRDLCVDVTIVNPYTRNFETQILSCSRQSPTNVNIMPLDVTQQGNYLQCVRLKCPGAFIFQK
jgi:hypothetical protein